MRLTGTRRDVYAGEAEARRNGRTCPRRSRSAGSRRARVRRGAGAGDLGRRRGRAAPAGARTTCAGESARDRGERTPASDARADAPCALLLGKLAALIPSPKREREKSEADAGRRLPGAG